MEFEKEKEFIKKYIRRVKEIDKEKKSLNNKFENWDVSNKYEELKLIYSEIKDLEKNLERDTLYNLIHKIFGIMFSGIKINELFSIRDKGVFRYRCQYTISLTTLISKQFTILDYLERSGSKQVNAEKIKIIEEILDITKEILDNMDKGEVKETFKKIVNKKILVINKDNYYSVNPIQFNEVDVTHVEMDKSRYGSVGSVIIHYQDIDSAFHSEYEKEMDFEEDTPNKHISLTKFALIEQLYTEIKFILIHAKNRLDNHYKRKLSMLNQIKEKASAYLVTANL